MSVPTPVLLLAAAIVVFVAARFFRAWLRYRGDRVITCPENQQPAGVRVDARHAAETQLLSVPDLRLETCSRWPEKAGCGQECLRQIESRPEDCLVRNILLKWYEGKNCAVCHEPIGHITLAGQNPALLPPGKSAVEWEEIAPEKLPAVLSTALPICFSCHIAERFAREHPELITNRARPM